MAVMPIVISDPLCLVLAGFPGNSAKGLDRLIVKFWDYRIFCIQELRF
jgi:hypothetical protein